jgi:6-methylsalicylate decarboxylase
MVFAGSDEDPEFGTRLCRMINEGNAELIAKHPGRFGAFASLPADGPEQALTELAYALDELRLDGVVLTSNVAGHYFGDPFLEPVLAELEHRQVPVFVHPVDSPCIEVLGFGRPSSIVEFPFDTARNITNGLYTGFFQRHPGLRLILAHCGGALPTLGWRIGEHTVMGRGPNDADIDPTHVAEVLHGLYYETALAGSRHSLLPTLQVTTAEHILFGTDWPAAPEPTVVRNIANLTSFDGFTTEQLRGVERDNALRLFPRFGSCEPGAPSDASTMSALKET